MGHSHLGLFLNFQKRTEMTDRIVLSTVHKPIMPVLKAFVTQSKAQDNIALTWAIVLLKASVTLKSTRQ
jgi:hypothetical protein